VRFTVLPTETQCISTGRRVPLSRSSTAVSMESVGAMFQTDSAPSPRLLTQPITFSFAIQITKRLWMDIRPVLGIQSG
jgi:hypothetical protein